MFGFDRLITPKIISILYVITVVLLLFAAVVQFMSGGVSAAIGFIVIAIFSRIFFECIMIAFKNNEYLRRIAESLEKDKIQP
ncbi:DUF4282 domain-containing protein [Brenneria izadpanahii]|uniref:DUF4282 domain-containing protein n=1 Tax=Brenneria izadpanahii TaxID=2722756 RepID=A0ABX7UVD6_9GAMM|nr:DUF4282 domain-containing protein [Brenneria izadpanahii]QTF08165.1 DUF4282 domain-containing protein [Brenneria izadpanahii]